ncbi:hypothetical protein GGQ80_003366 [Sphingomonas jinjuensis]|uniref:Ice-binding protein C-terminal domain-containing protein n=1 Tax=Sphingomonas jinjuensis TaxID=535907 RepID=A0A840F885_9SPHN|nr:PEPxxWA-CTERM sorting domain-containing protein [Sphingomonas jinjuensis]MBB4155443.1 hypothetical protein [Sphingomonas jinjuensis]
MAATTAIAASPASAAINICTGNNCVATNENVMVSAATNQATINGTGASSGIGVLFTSSERLNGNANGQADVSATDGLLNGLTFSLAGGATFATATFNLFPLPGNAANQAVRVLLTYTGGSRTIDINTNGQNFLGISGNAGERFTSVGFVADPATSGIQDLRQLRLGGVSAVPEPATWAMMFLGMGLVGAAHRHRSRRTGAWAGVTA